MRQRRIAYVRDRVTFRVRVRVRVRVGVRVRARGRLQSTKSGEN